jgi:hypothetical protein
MDVTQDVKGCKIELISLYIKDNIVDIVHYDF